MITEQNLKYQLLQTIGRYYPLGLPYSNDEFIGYKELLGILDEKIEALTKKNRIEPWARIVDQIPSICEGKGFLDRAFHHYPSLHLIVTLMEVQDRLLVRTRAFHLHISLLGPYYSIFFTEEFKLFNLNPGEQLRRVVWPMGPTLEGEEALHELINELVLQNYSHYKFADHQTLMELKLLGGIPHGEDLESEMFQNPRFEFTAFDYLFGKFDSGNQ